jgi:hypothetical protein
LVLLPFYYTSIGDSFLILILKYRLYIDVCLGKQSGNATPPKSDDGSGISSPYNPRQLVHVDEKFNWEGNAEDIFAIEKQIGKG